MKNILKNRTILGIACIMLSLIICFGLTPLFNNAITAKTNIVRASKYIAKGEMITPDMVQTVEVGKYNMPDTVLKNNENIIGKYAKADLYKGDYILNTKVSDVPIANYEYLYNFDGTKRAISVTIKSFATGLSGKLESGDIVSIMVSDYGELKETVSPPELQYVQVLAVTADTGRDTEKIQNTSGDFMEDDNELPSTVTLKVSPEQARLLAELEAKGKIHIVFVYRGNEDNSRKFLEEQSKTLLEIQNKLEGSNEEEIEVGRPIPTEDTEYKAEGEENINAEQ